MDTIGTKIFVLISEVSLFQGVNNIKLGLSQVSCLTRGPYSEVSFKRGSTVSLEVRHCMLPYIRDQLLELVKESLLVSLL